MAEQASGLEVLIRSILDAQGFNELKSKLSEAIEQTREKQRADEDASEGSKKFGESLHELGDEMAKAAAEVLLGREALKFFKEALDEAVEGQKVLEQFAAINESVGKATAHSRQENEEWLKSMEMASGKTKQEIIPGYMKLVEVTGSVEKAQALSQIAAGAAARGFGEMGESATTLSRYLLNPDGPVRGTSALALEIKKFQKEGVSGTEVMKRLAEQFGDGGKNVNTAAMQIARAKVQFSEFKENVGNLYISMVQYLKPAFELIAGAITSVIVSAKRLGADLGTLFSSFGSFFDAIKAALSGNFSEAKRIFTDAFKNLKEGFAENKIEATEAGKKIMDAFHMGSKAIKETSDVAKLAADSFVKTKGTVEDLATAITRMEVQAKLAAHGEEDLQQKLIEGYRKILVTVKMTADERDKINLKIRESEMKLTDMETQELAKREKFAEQAEKKRLSEEDKAFKKKTAAHEKFLKSSTRDEQAYLRALIEFYNQDLSNYTLTAEQKESIAEKVEAAQEELNAKQAKSNADMNAAILDSAVTTLGNAFGIGKEIAIANAIINTYEGATKALAQGGILGEVMAAIVIATGIAQIATIASTNPGTTASTGAATATSSGQGFDDPAHDFKAYVGGQKWADDMVGQFSAGASAGFRSQMVNNDNRKYNTSTQQNKTTNYNIKAPGYVDSANKAGMRRFVRELQIADTLEGARTLK